MALVQGLAQKPGTAARLQRWEGCGGTPLDAEDKFGKNILSAAF